MQERQYLDDHLNTHFRFSDDDDRETRLRKEIYHWNKGIEKDESLLTNGIYGTGFFSIVYGGMLYSSGIPLPPYDEGELGMLVFGGVLLTGIVKTIVGAYRIKDKIRRVNQFQEELDQIAGTDQGKHKYSSLLD